jgi:D-sedoheptulose 7-phosphate isomerase
MDTHLQKILEQSEGLTDYYHSYVDYLHKLLSQLDGKTVDEVANVFLEARKNGKTIYFVGNGGSASTASHFCQDLAQLGNKAKCEGFRVLSLTDNVSYITAAGNDYGYESIFTRQMEFLFNEGDVLVAISASGNSPNVVNATKLAQERGGVAVALVGFDGGELGKLADHSIRLQTPKGEYGPVEDAHMILDHIITTYLMHKLKSHEC